MFRALQIKIQDHIHASEKDLLVIISLCSRLELFSARLPQYPTLKTRLKPPLQVMVPATPTSVKSQSKQKTTKRLTYQDIAVQAKGDPFNWFSNFWQTHIEQHRRLACFTAATRLSSCPLQAADRFLCSC